MCIGRLYKALNYILGDKIHDSDSVLRESIFSVRPGRVFRDRIDFSHNEVKTWKALFYTKFGWLFTVLRGQSDFV